MRSEAAPRSLPFARRFPLYLAERFPIGPYSVLILALVAAAVAVADAEAGGLRLGFSDLASFGVALLVFFHLRVFDEHKDADKDLVAHPGRVLSRGIVTLRELAVAGGVAIALEAALAALQGGTALAAWAAVLGWSLLMRVEFFAKGFLGRHVLVYMVTHNPIVALLVWYVVLAHGGRPLAPAVLGFVAVATLTSLGFEAGRKVRAPADERVGQDTYTKALGLRGAVALVVVLAFASGAAAVATGLLAGTSAVFLVLAPVVMGAVAFVALRFGRAPDAKGAKAVDAAASGGALVVYVALAVDLAVSLGVAWMP